MNTQSNADVDEGMTVFKEAFTRRDAAALVQVYIVMENPLLALDLQNQSKDRVIIAENTFPNEPCL